MKKTTAFITAVLVCLSVLFGAFDLCLRTQAAPGRSFPERDGEVLFDVGSAYNVVPGDTVTISVLVSGPNTPFDGLALNFGYDPAALSVQSVEKGELLRNAADDVMCLFDHTSVSGEISVAVLCPTQPVDPNGELIKISFTALSGFDSEQVVSIIVREFYQMPLGSFESTSIPYEISNGVISPFADPDQIFTVTYTGAYTGTDTVQYGGSVTLPVLETEGVHYTFTVDGQPWDGTNITSDVTVEVGMEIDVYTVVFLDPVDGEVLKTEEVFYTGSATAPEAPSHYGYTFSGWDKDFSVVTSDMIVTAVYTPVDFTVIFTDGLDNILSTQSVPYHTAASAPEVPPREGWTFTGWDADFSSVEHDMVVNAVWERTMCTVTFTGVYSATVLVEYGGDCELPVYNSASIHYTFTVDGQPWDGTNITSDVTVTVGVAVNTYTVTFVDWDGTVLSEQQVSHGAAASAPADPTRAGYTFIGWDKDFSKITANLTVTALYEQNGQSAVLLGDVNCDGSVDFSDAAALAAYLMGGSALSDEALANANANGDSGVTIADITAIYAIIFGG